ncbi:hypothetical protein S7335_3104 [Synechococcus sp. PCC 7335]|nr:hypothetical protein S7335_3104 [Synechococcus sp. PCC 7335]
MQWINLTSLSAICENLFSSRSVTITLHHNTEYATVLVDSLP